MTKRSLLLCLTIALTLPAAAQQSAGDKILGEVVPLCYEGTIERSPFAGKLPSGYTAEQITVKSEDPYCAYSGALIRFPSGRWYVGSPWPISGYQGTPAAKLKDFAWDRMNETFIPEMKGDDGSLVKVSVSHVTEAGRVELEGYVDPAGIVFMMGDVATSVDDLLAKRSTRLAPILAKAPVKGPKDAPITIIEFSDFQCPSCKHAHEFLPRILKKYEGKVRYTRVDLPLVSSHPWAFAASVIGRAIYRQSPDAFWAWKDAVYSNQAELSPFTIDQFGRNFASDHGIDMAKYDADVVSEELHKEILAGVGAAYTIHIAATPSYIVNGHFVSSGTDGKNLERYLAENAAN